MTPTQKRRAGFVGFILIGLSLTVWFVLKALSQNINFFYTPTALVETAPAEHKTIRIGGMVVPGSVERGDDLMVEFVLTDFNEQIRVQYQGLLPDLFREGQGIVALGKLESGPTFKAKQVLAKHDEKYMPPEIAKGIVKGVSS